MKTVTCNQVGGPCDAAITATTVDEWMTKGMDHMKAAHPEMVAGIEAMSKEESDKWMADFMTKWNAAPEIA